MSRTFSPIAAALGARGALVLAATGVLAVAMPAAWSAPEATARQLVAAPLPPAAASVTVTSHFVWTPPSSDTGSDLSVIDNGATNDHPGDLLFVTPNFTAGGVCGCVPEPGALGVFYNSSDQWGIIREDMNAIHAGVSFNVLVVPKNKTGKSAFVHTAGSSNTGGNHTFISSPLINGKPNALIQVTQVVTPGGTGVKIFNPHAVGVVYDPLNKKWAIFNEDNTAMPVGASFNVLIGSAPSNGGHAQRLTTTSSNKNDDTTFFSNPQTTGNPNNVTFVTQDWNPGGGDSGTYNNAQTGVLYLGTRERVLNENAASMPLHAAFNLLIFSS